MERKKFCNTNELPWEELGGGVSRQILGFDNQIMMVKVKFETGAIGSLHQHFHAQTAYCATGKFEFTIDGEKSMVNAGDGVYIAPNLLHGVFCVEAGILVDVFSPVREDFLDGSVASYFGKK